MISFLVNQSRFLMATTAPESFINPVTSNACSAAQNWFTYFIHTHRCASFYSGYFCCCSIDEMTFCSITSINPQHCVWLKLIHQAVSPLLPGSECSTYLENHLTSKIAPLMSAW